MRFGDERVREPLGGQAHSETRPIWPAAALGSVHLAVDRDLARDGPFLVLIL